MSNVTRDGDTVTVRCCYEPENDCLVIRPYDDDHFRPVLYGIPILERADLAALGDACHALAGEPDWKALAVKFGRAVIAHQAVFEATRDGLSYHDPRMQQALQAEEGALAAITDAEWAALEEVNLRETNIS